MSTYLMYVDESGVPEPANTSHFVLCGLAIPAETWREKSSQIASLKLKYSLSGVEIHTGWMVRKYLEQVRIPNFDSLDYDARRRAVIAQRTTNLRVAAATKSNKSYRNTVKNFRKTEPFIHLTYAERTACVKELCQLVASWHDCRIFADAIDKVRYNYQDTPYQGAFTQVVSRYEAFLKHYGRSTGENLLGLIIQDNNKNEALRLKKMMKKFYSQGTAWRDIDRIVETPLFVDSELTDMIQVVDLCAYATRRFFERGETELFDIIYSRFDRLINGVLVGIRHFTGTVRCTCMVCDRR